MTRSAVGFHDTSASRSIEQALSPTQIRALEEDCQLLGLERSSWRRVPTIRVKYESVAAAGTALQIMRSENRAWTDALLAACVRLGLSYEAVRKRLHAWQQGPRILPTGSAEVGEASRPALQPTTRP